MSRRSWRNFDIPLFLATLALMVIGIATIYSATHSPALGENLLGHLAGRQAIYAVLGLAFLFILASVDYQLWAEFHLPLYVAGVVSLAAVLIIGRVFHGARRWLDFGLIPFQPSELSKILLIVALARYLEGRRDKGNPWWTLAVSLGLTAIPAALVYLEPDLGTALALGTIWAGMALLGGIPLRYMATLGALALPAIPLVWRFVLKGYMRARLLIFLSPEADPLGAGYNILQARISIGAGGLWGTGFRAGTQSQLQFLTVRHTDYIYSVLAEEWGFAGGIILLLLLGVVLLRTVRIASQARDGLGELVASGVAMAILFQSFVNIGMNLGLVPPTGITLPFVSHGGSSLVTLLMAQGLVQSIAIHRRRLEFQG